MKTILVTGVLGFIFSNFIKKVIDEYPEYRFIGVDKAVRFYNLKNQYSHPNYKFYLGDIADPHFINNVFTIEKPDIVINGAAESFVDDSIADIMPFLHSNIIGTQILVNHSLKFKVEKFVQISTDECLGQQLNINDKPWDESCPMLPRNPYACSKACSELIVNSAHLTHGLQYQITRSCNVYGPQQKKINLIPHILNGLISNQPITIHGDGLNFRQYLFVDDKVGAIMKIVKYGNINQIYNISDNNFFTNLGMVDYLASKLNKSPNIKFIENRKSHDFGYNLSNNKIKSLGWSPKHSLKEGMDKTIAWYLNNLNLYDK